MTTRFFSVLVTFVLFISFVSAQDELAGVDPEDKVIYLDPPGGPDSLDGIAAEFKEADRKPGLIRLSRENWRRGVLSFFRLPVALTQEDLRAANVDVAIIGAPVDMGVGLRGAGEGPRALRAAMRGTGGSNAHMHVGVAWKKELIAVDYGNSPIDILSVERSMPPCLLYTSDAADE